MKTIIAQFLMKFLPCTSYSCWIQSLRNFFSSNPAPHLRRSGGLCRPLIGRQAGLSRLLIGRLVGTVQARNRLGYRGDPLALRVLVRGNQGVTAGPFALFAPLRATTAALCRRTFGAPEDAKSVLVCNIHRCCQKMTDPAVPD
jgi:hypothetical protein